MFVGHALLAGALVAGLARFRGTDPRSALALGALAGAFATLPDLDMLYAPVGLVFADGTGPLALASSFWASGSLVHRTVTHSLVVAVPVAVAVWLWASARSPAAETAARRRDAVLAIGVLGALVATAIATAGPLAGLVMAAFGLGSLAVTELATRRVAARPATVGRVALLALWSHPFGDLFTGQPPAFLYPFETTLVARRVTLHPDPTLNLLGAFGVELAAIWAGVAVAMWVAGVRPTVSPRASLGAGYAASVFVVPAPTLDQSYQFVFTILAVGSVGLFPRLRRTDSLTSPGFRRPDAVAALVTGLAAVTLAWLTYAVVYVRGVPA
jgi:membrane-bound metal-dependent hydrolase YbcI (DUF457 family)